jgi:DNA-binding MarR family transcriptional regulator
VAPMFTDCYCTQLRRASNALTKIYDEALRPTGLRITQFSLLRGLGRLGEATLTELSEEAALDLTTISRNVKILIKFGWIDVLPCEADKREKLLRLTETGRDVIAKAMPGWREAQRRIDEHMRGLFGVPAEDHLLEVLEALQKAAQQRP